MSIFLREYTFYTRMEQVTHSQLEARSYKFYIQDFNYLQNSFKLNVPDLFTVSFDFTFDHFL